MKRMMGIILGLLVFGISFSGIAFAKTVSGKVSAVDATAKKITVTSKDAAGAEQKSEIWVNADATFAGVTALGDLKDGDSVTVEAEQQDGNWKASKVTKA